MSLDTLIKEKMNGFHEEEINSLLDQSSNPFQQIFSQETYFKVLNLAIKRAEDAEKKLEESKDRIKELENLSMTDELTGILNRRGFLHEFKRSMAQSKRNKSKGVLSFWDIDHFKDINDEHGHLIGDACLKFFSNILRKNLRETDYVARISGDEFAVIMHETELEPAYKRLNYIKNLIHKTKFEQFNCSLELEFSFGVTEYDGSEEIDTLIDIVDNKMYFEKKKNKSSS